MKANTIKYSLLVSLVLLFVGPVNGIHATNHSGKYRLAVVAVTNDTGQDAFSDLLIVQGMASLLADFFYDSGKFIPVEDNPEIKSRIKGLLAAYAEKELDLKKTDIRPDELKTDALASAVITDMTKTRFSGFSALFSGAKTTITITVKVELRMPDGKVYMATGEGEGVTKAVGAFFQIRNDKIAFDKTTVGRAVKQAIGDAVKKILEQLK